MASLRILILSRNPELYSTKSIYNAARRRGHFVRIVDHLHCDLVLDGSRSEVYVYGQPLKGYHAIIPRIGHTVTKQGAAIIRQFEAKGIFSCMAAEALLRARDKLTCLQLLVQHNVPVPKTLLVNNYLVLDQMQELIPDYPKIIKVLSGTHGLGVLKADDPKVMAMMMETFYNLKQRAIIQEYIRESNGSDVRVFCVDGEVVASMIRTAADGEYRSNLHRGGSAVVADLSEEEKALALKATEIMGLNISGVDMLRSNSGPQILEVNASPGLEGIETVTKIDISKKIIELIEKNVISGGIHGRGS